MKLRNIGSAVVALAVAELWIALPTAAQPFPSKPIRIVVPFGAGSSTDIIARVVGQPLGQALGQPVVIENKPGGDGAVAAGDVRRAAGDGHTLMLATNSPLSVVPHLHKQPPYDPVTEFTAISHVGYYTFIIVVIPAVPARTLAELFAHAKANPGKVNYGTGNTGSIVSTALLIALAKVEMLHVPYKTEPVAIPDLLAGQIHVMNSSYSPLAPHLRDGKLWALAVMTPARSPLLPDVPTIEEAGFKDFPVVPFAALVGPARIPRDVVERLNKEVVAILAREEIRKQLDAQAFAAQSSSVDELARLIKERLDVWGRIMRSAGIEPQ